MTLVAYVLTMPNCGSWNGRWSGEGSIYAVVRSYNKSDTPKEGRHYYNFGDGWGANVEVRYVKVKEANALRRASKGFSGYEWMIKEIELYGRILTLEARYALKHANS